MNSKGLISWLSNLVLGCILVAGMCLVAPEIAFAGGATAETVYIGDNTQIDVDDTLSNAIPIGFTFKFYGVDYTQLYVCSNGLLQFSDNPSVTKLVQNTGLYNPNRDIPSSISNIANPGNLIAPFWDDLTTQPKAASTYNKTIYYKTIGDAPNRQFVVQWTNMYFWNTTIQLGTFQAILDEGSNKIQLQYRTLLGQNGDNCFGKSATVGIENAAGSAAVKYTYLGSNGIVPKLLSPKQAISFSPDGAGSYVMNENDAYLPVYLTDAELPSMPTVDSSYVPDGAVNARVHAVLGWHAADRAESYKILVSKSPKFSGSLVATKTTTTATACALSVLDKNTTYYWNIEAINSKGSTMSPTFSFETGNGGQITPTFVPTAGAVVLGTELNIISAGAEHIYYTTDGTDPTPVATGPVMEFDVTSKPVISMAMTVKAIAVKSGQEESDIGTAAYMIAPPGASGDLDSIVLSGSPANYVFTSDAYIYLNVGVANSVSEITVTPTGNGSISVNGIAVLSGHASPPISLIAGTEKTIEIVFTQPGKTAKTYMIKVVRAGASSNGSSHSGGHSSSSAAAAGTGSIPVTVNGNTETSATTKTTQEAGITTMTVDASVDVLGKRIDALAAQPNANQPNLVEIAAQSNGANNVVLGLTGDLVKKMEEKDASLSFKSDGIKYVLPAGEVNIAKVAEQLGITDVNDLKNIKVEVKISKPSADTIKEIEKSAQAKSYEIVFAPVSFEITATATVAGKTQSVNVNSFGAYVQRVIEIPAGVDPKKITTGIVYNSDGTFSHIPTTVFEKDGKWYAKLNSLTNSTYSIIYNPIEVSEVSSHWAKKSVNDLASRLIITDYAGYPPDSAITRGEFADYIAKALGVFRTGKSATKFSDVAVGSKLSDSVAAANEFGVISGYADGTFKPEGSITREEAMSMFARAMKVTKLAPKTMNDLSGFTDNTKIAAWAKNDVQTAVSSGIFSGRTVTTLAPQGTFTKAEAATAMRNLLVQSKLINE